MLARLEWRMALRSVRASIAFPYFVENEKGQGNGCMGDWQKCRAAIDQWADDFVKPPIFTKRFLHRRFSANYHGLL